jgi:hypothetical protein
MAFEVKKIPVCIYFGVFIALVSFKAKSQSCQQVFSDGFIFYDRFDTRLTEDVLLPNLRRLDQWNLLDQKTLEVPYSFSEIQSRRIRVYQNSRWRWKLDFTHLNTDRLAATAMPEGTPVPMSVIFNRTSRQLALGPDIYKTQFELNSIAADDFMYDGVLSLSPLERGQIGDAIFFVQNQDIERITNILNRDILDEHYPNGVPQNLITLNRILTLYTSAHHENALRSDPRHLLPDWFVASSQGVPVLVLDEPLRIEQNTLILGERAEILALHYILGVLPHMRLLKTPEGTFHLAIPLQNLSWLDLNNIYDWLDPEVPILSLQTMLSLHQLIEKMERAQIDFFQQTFDLKSSKDIYERLAEKIETLSAGGDRVYIGIGTKQSTYIDNSDLRDVTARIGLYSTDQRPAPRDTIPGSVNESYPLSQISTILRIFYLLHMDPKNQVSFLKALLDQQDYLSFFEIFSVVTISAKTQENVSLVSQLEVLTDLIYSSFDIQVGVNDFYLQKKARWKNGNVRRGHGRHASEFNVPKEVYWKAAEEFFQFTDSHQLLARRSSGTIMKYDLKTNEFGIITTDGEIITYYRLDWEHRQGHQDKFNYLGENLGR